jgi:hypothetical protein
MTALRGFLLGCVPVGVEVIQSQANRVPEPAGADFILMTPTLRQRMSTNLDKWPAVAAAAAIDRSHSTSIEIQLDIHGPTGADYAQIIGTLFRDEYACDLMQDAGISPLFATDGMQAPFINAEKQYENRWVMKVTLGASPIVSTPQEFAATLAATLRPVI